MLFADGPNVLMARTLNISEDGLLVDELPSFPEADEVPLMISLPLFPMFKNVSLEQLGAMGPEPLQRKIFRAKARFVRKMQLTQDLDNIFRSKFGLQFVKMMDTDRKLIDQYVAIFSSNLVHLQTLIDSYNSDDEARERCKKLAPLLGYREHKISQLRLDVTHDYQSLQWL
jgi:hypothetical protein